MSTETEKEDEERRNATETEDVTDDEAEFVAPSAELDDADVEADVEAESDVDVEPVGSDAGSRWDEPVETPLVTAASVTTAGATTDHVGGPLITGRQAFEERWITVQAGFVDDPRQAVEHADQVLADVLVEVADAYARQREALASSWHESTPSTDELRIAFQSYRTFFFRLLDT